MTYFTPHWGDDQNHSLIFNSKHITFANTVLCNYDSNRKPSMIHYHKSLWPHHCWQTDVFLWTNHTQADLPPNIYHKGFASEKQNQINCIQANACAHLVFNAIKLHCFQIEHIISRGSFERIRFIFDIPVILFSFLAQQWWAIVSSRGMV